METFLTVVHILVALFMIFVIIVQGGNSGGVGAAFGGGNSQGVFGASGATSFLGKLTYAAAAVFMVTSIGLTVAQKQAGETGLTKKLEQTAAQPEEKSDAPSGNNEAAPASTQEKPAE